MIFRKVIEIRKPVRLYDRGDRFALWGSCFSTGSEKFPCVQGPHLHFHRLKLHFWHWVIELPLLSFRKRSAYWQMLRKIGTTDFPLSVRAHSTLGGISSYCRRKIRSSRISSFSVAARTAIR